MSLFRMFTSSVMSIKIIITRKSFRNHLPPNNTKFKGAKQVPYSDQHTAQRRHCREILHAVVQGPEVSSPNSGQSFIRRAVSELRVSLFTHFIRIFCLFFLYKTLKSTYTAYELTDNVSLARAYSLILFLYFHFFIILFILSIKITAPTPPLAIRPRAAQNET